MSGLLAVAAPGHALAVDLGVPVDPGSPPGRDYAFPLSSARNTPSSDLLSGTVIALAVAVLGAGGLGALALRRLHDRDERLTGS